MKHKLLPLTLIMLFGLGVGALAGCGEKTDEPPASSDTGSEPSQPSEEPSQPSEEPSQPSEEPSVPPVVEVTSFSISNKEDLKKEWHAGEDKRRIEFAIEPEINVLLAIQKKDLVITSSKADVVKVEGQYLFAAAEGDATVTAAYKDKFTDSVELSILAKKGESAMKGGTLAEIRASYDADGDMKALYYHHSKIASMTLVEGHIDQFGNMFVTDDSLGEKESIMVYGVTAYPDALTYLDTGAYKYVNPGVGTAETNPNWRPAFKNPDMVGLKVGDELDMVSVAKVYNGTYEFMSILRGVNGRIISNYVRTTDELLSETEFQNRWSYEVKGKIIGWRDDEATGPTEFGNVRIQTEGSEKPVLVYGLTADTDALKVDKDAGHLRFDNPKNFLANEATKDLKIGDEITVIGVRADYQGAIQLQGYLKPKAEPRLDVGKTSVKVRKDETYQIPAKVVNGTGDEVLTYASSDTAIVTVSESGLVKGIAKGEAEVTVTCAALDLSKVIKFECYEPIAAPTGEIESKTLAEIIALDSTRFPKDIYKTSFKVKDLDTSDKKKMFGNMIAVDLADDSKEIPVYGASAKAEAIAWNDYHGNYQYTNQKDFDKNAVTKDIKDGDTLEVIAGRFDFYKGDPLKLEKAQISVVVTKVIAAAGGGDVPVPGGGEGTGGEGSGGETTPVAGFGVPENYDIALTVKSFPGEGGNYTTEEAEVTQNGLVFKANNYIAGTKGQVRGNKEDPAQNFYLYNVTAMPRAIASIVITENVTGNTTFKDTKGEGPYLATGAESQAAVTEGGTAAVLAVEEGGAGSSLTFTPAAGETGTYFKIYSPKKFTINSVTGVMIYITLVAA